jgi:hypothetical protein
VDVEYRIISFGVADSEQLELGVILRAGEIVLQVVGDVRSREDERPVQILGCGGI